MGKSAAILVVLVLAASSLVMAKPAGAVIPKPSVPEFSIKYVAQPYDVSPTTTIDPYTGKTVTSQTGYHVENESIEITIRNQPPFTPLKLDNDHYASLFYNISFKGHFEEDWHYYSYDLNTEYFISQSDSEYTVISFKQIPSKGQIDFRVQARIGYFTYYYMPWKVYDFTGETSGWSNTQTITIGESASTTTPNTSPSQSSPTPTASSLSSPNATATPETSAVQAGVLFGLGWEEIALIILSVAVVGLIALVVFQRRSNKRPPLASG